MSSHMQVAAIILEQIRAGRVGNCSGAYAMLCWGTYGKLAHPPHENSRGALSFRVNGRKFEGEVMIELAGDDTYTIWCSPHTTGFIC